MGTEQIQGIIFDLDGTLYHMKFMKMKMAFQLRGSLVYLRKLFAARSAIRGQQFDNRQALLTRFYQELGAATGKSTADAERWYDGEFYPAFVRVLRQAKPRGGLDSLLARLRGKDVKLAVVSDFGRVRERLEALGISPAHFDVLKCSEANGVLKPAPEPFSSVARVWNMAPENLLVVGDRDDRDGEGARNAGMPFLGISDGRKKDADFYCWNDAVTMIEKFTNCGVNV